MGNLIISFLIALVVMCASIAQAGTSARVCYREPGQNRGVYVNNGNNPAGAGLSDFNSCEIKFFDVDYTGMTAPALLFSIDTVGSGVGGNDRCLNLSEAQTTQLIGTECVPEARQVDIVCDDSSGNQAPTIRFFRIFEPASFPPGPVQTPQYDAATGGIKFREPALKTENAALLDNLHRCEAAAFDTSTTPPTLLQTVVFNAAGVAGNQVKNGAFSAGTVAAGVDEVQYKCFNIDGTVGPLTITDTVEDPNDPHPARDVRVQDD